MRRKNFTTCDRAGHPILIATVKKDICSGIKVTSPNTKDSPVGVSNIKRESCAYLVLSIVEAKLQFTSIAPFEFLLRK